VERVGEVRILRGFASEKGVRLTFVL